MKQGVLCLAALLTSAGALAHHGWSEYDADKPLRLSGTIEESGYSHPHGHISLEAQGKTWKVVLAPPTRMQNRGLSKEMLSQGRQATVEGYPNRNNPDEVRAERITIDEKTTELR